MKKESRLLRIGVLGCGPISQIAHFDACRKARNAELYAICDLADELRERMAAVHQPKVSFRDYDQLLADPLVDAVIIAIADQFHVSADGNLSWEMTERFVFEGEPMVLRQTRGRGIHKPRLLDAALSITTAFTGYGKEPPYRDSIGEDGYPRYKYERTDPNLSTNRALRTAMAATS